MTEKTIFHKGDTIEMRSEGYRVRYKSIISSELDFKFVSAFCTRMVL